MGHVLLSVAEFVLVLGGISVLLMVLLVLGIGAACWGIARMFSGKPAPKYKGKQKATEIELLRRQLFEARNTAYESALASEKAIQQLQQRLQALEAERVSSFVSVRR